MEILTQRETRSTRYICIAIVALYVMVAYKDIKKGFIEGYNNINSVTQASRHPNNSWSEQDFFLNRYILCTFYIG